MATHTIVIPQWHPPRLNQWDGRHWAVRARLKGVCRNLVGYYVAALRVPPARGKRRVSLEIGLKKGQRAGDPDAYWKATLDALVASRSLLDDNRQGVELAPVGFARRDGWWGATITLEDLWEGTP